MLGCQIISTFTKTSLLLASACGGTYIICLAPFKILQQGIPSVVPAGIPQHSHAVQKMVILCLFRSTS